MAVKPVTSSRAYSVGPSVSIAELPYHATAGAQPVALGGHSLLGLGLDATLPLALSRGVRLEWTSAALPSDQVALDVHSRVQLRVWNCAPARLNEQGGVGVGELGVIGRGRVHQVVQPALAQRADQQEQRAHAEHGRQRERGHLPQALGTQ